MALGRAFITLLLFVSLRVGAEHHVIGSEDLVFAHQVEPFLALYDQYAVRGLAGAGHAGQQAEQEQCSEGMLNRLPADGTSPCVLHPHALFVRFLF